MADVHSDAQGMEHPLMLLVNPDNTSADYAEQDVRSALRQLGFDVERNPDLEETPMRWIKALREMTEGYGQSAEEILSKRFACEGANDLVILRDIPFVSLCEHHLLPFTGVATVGYLPDGYVVGLSKLARLVDCFSRRLQMQERLGNQIADAIETHLASKAVGVLIDAHHSCMGCRGVRKQSASMVTPHYRGFLRSNRRLREEFISLSKWRA